MNKQVCILIGQINKHFENHAILTQDDFEKMLREEYNAEVRRNIPEDEGAPALNVDINKED